MWWNPPIFPGDRLLSTRDVGSYLDAGSHNTELDYTWFYNICRYWSLIHDCTRCAKFRSNLAWADHRIVHPKWSSKETARLMVLWKPLSQNCPFHFSPCSCWIFWKLPYMHCLHCEWRFILWRAVNESCDSIESCSTLLANKKQEHSITTPPHLTANGNVSGV